jgi:hypothetical protein
MTCGDIPKEARKVVGARHLSIGEFVCGTARFLPHLDDGPFFACGRWPNSPRRVIADISSGPAMMRKTLMASLWMKPSRPMSMTQASS